MKNKLKIKFIFSLVLFCITLYLLFGINMNSRTINFNFTYKEKYNPILSKLNSIEKIVTYCDSINSSLNSGKFDTANYVHTLSEIVKYRFYHGVAEYSISDNWILYFLGKYTWTHFSAIIIPDDILKHSEGLCSQQTIIFIECLNRKNINFRTVGLGLKEGPGHFLSEVYYNGSWHLFDIDKEPNLDNTDVIRASMDFYKKHPEKLHVIYDGIIEKETLNSMLKTISYNEVNEIPAKNMLLFHRFTFVLCYIFPFLFLVMSFWLYIKRQ